MLTTDGVGIANVTFEPGCRNNWHIHHNAGQILLCTAGRGYYQEFGKPAQEMKPGDVISIPPEVKHWHGASPNSWFSHLAVEVPGENKSNEWLDSSLKFHIQNAKNHGVTAEEMAEILTHAAFYAGWPKAWAAFRMAKEIYS